MNLSKYNMVSVIFFVYSWFCILFFRSSFLFPACYLSYISFNFLCGSRPFPTYILSPQSVLSSCVVTTSFKYYSFSSWSLSYFVLFCIYFPNFLSLSICSLCYRMCLLISFMISVFLTAYFLS